MYQKTENHEISRPFLWQIGLFTLLVLAIITYSTQYLVTERTSAVQDTQTLLFPWLVAARHTLENALGAFSGKPPEDVKFYEIARALTAVLISGILCPTVFLLGWRRRVLSREHGQAHRPLTFSAVLYGLCTAMTLYIAVAIGPMTYSAEMTRTNIRAAQEVQSHRDDIINELNLVANEAYQYYLLPKELGGGGRSYLQFVLPPEMLKSKSAQYSLTPDRKEIKMRAASIPYVDCGIEVELDTMGRLSKWNYAGRFR